MSLFLAPDWFKNTYIGIEVEQFIGIGVMILVAGAVYVLLTQLLRIFVRARLSSEDREFWDQERARLRRSLLVGVVAITVILGFPTLEFSSGVENVVNQIAIFLGAGALVWMAFRAIDIFTDVLERRAEKTVSRIDDQLVPLLNSTLKGVAILVGGLFVLANLGVNVTSLVAGLGIGGLAIALAAQDTIRNLLGGVTIFADRPFQVGDWVVVNDIEGTVEHVGFRSSRVRTFYNSVVTVPNARIVDTHVDNMGLRQWRRYKTTLGLAYHTTTDQVQAFVEGVRALIRANPGMRKDYYIVEFHGFGASTLDVLVYCFIDAPNWNDELRTRHVLNLDIMRLAEDLGIEFAFPTQTLHVASQPGQPAVAPPAPARDELGEIVEGYSPNGSAGQRVDAPITAGFDNTPDAS
ncbi:MAG: mechanosensitive ion channel family protein [Dehalococcoidia bacterium]|nr:mechanosensitive ion channel family protein [Dehalococcoidia bacterium]MYA54101.1 mechanosensitive ion channel family protein [Dehalococcoidia bacterium]